MAALTNPSQEEVRKFITQGEANPSTGMYNDNSSGHYPTHGLGINFNKKTREFIEAYINSLGSKVPPETRFSINTPVDHYIYNGTSWVIDETAGKKSLIDEIMWLISPSNSAHRPFAENSGIPMDDPIRMATDPEINEQAFDEVVYDAYLNGKYGITGVISNVGSGIWNKLDKNERLALYSLNYNANTLIGKNLKSALSFYVNGSSDENKMLGKLSAWYEILYASNGGGDRKGVQNRRFMEADAFLGDVHNKIPEGDDPKKGEGHNNSIILVDNFAEANVTIAFMNKFSEQMIRYMGNISEYEKRNYEIVQNNFSKAVSVFLSNQNYKGAYNINTLFKDWNLYTDLQIDLNSDGRPDGTTNYGNIIGSDKRDLIFITGEQDGTTVHADAGDDFVGGSSKKDIIYSGSGDDVIYTYGGNDEVYTTDGKKEDYNEVYLGAGSDIFRGGDGDDFVDGGSGRIDLKHVSSNIGAEDATTDINDIDLGGGQNYYIGGKGTDKVQGSGNNTVYLGAGNDNFTGGDGADIVDGGTGATGGLTGISQEIMEDTTSNINDISLGGGDDIYVGGLSQDQVSATSGDNLVILGAGSDTYTGGSGADIVDGGSGSVIKIKEDLINAGYTEVSQLTMDKLKDNSYDTNTIHLGAGNDVYTGGVGIDIVYSGQGNDTINTGGNDDIVYTDDSTDSKDINKVFLGSGNDEFHGGDGIDIVDGGSENPDIEGIYDPANMVDDEDNENTVHLGGGDDRYTGGIGKDIVYAGTGNDDISTGEGNDHVYTNDTNNENENKTIHLGGGDDKFTGGVANDHVTSGSSSDTNNNHKNIDLGNGNNSYVGGDAQDNVTAGSGDDNISTGGGNDIIDTGDGNNTANGGAGDDRMTGGSGNDTLDGGTGKDVFNGKGGNNTINPGNDNDDDTIIAGKGPGKDTISNFKDNDTVIIPEGIVDNRSENGDLIFTTPSGREVILKGRGEPEDPEDEDPQPTLPPNVFDGEGTLYKPDEEGKYRPVDNGLPPFTPDEPNKDKGNANDGKKHAESQSSPLVVDLDGDGIETLGSGVGIYFDHDNNGFSEDTGWVGKDDGLLVRDINGNGQIDNGTELFGNNTLLSNGEKAKNGFEALKELDSNNDNVFDPNDAAWNEVKVWKDGNSNGIVDDGELLTMEQAGITGVDLNYVDHNYRDDHSDEHGNTCKQESTFSKADGSTGQVSDIWFDRNTADSKYEAIDVPEDIKTLPNLQGFGNVVSLWEAMASDETGELKQLVEQYLNTTNITERRNLMTDIIYHWTGVEDIDPESRAAYGENYIQDARIIEALEEFWGSDYVNQNWLGNEESNPRQQASLILIKTFEDLRDSMMGKLDMQTHYKELFEGISVHYDNEIEDISADVSGFVEQLKTMYDENPADILGIMENLAKLIQEQSVVAPYIIDAIRATGENLDHNISTYLKNFGDVNAYITNGNDTINGTSGNDYIDGLSGNDVIYGNDGDDTLVGNAGNDRLIGGNGNDTYIFNAGWGNDTIDNSSNDDPSSCEDTIQFGSDIAVDDIVIKRQENDLILSTKDGSNTLRVFSYFVEAGATNNTIKYIKFADGTTWTYEDVRLAWNQNPVSVDGGVTLEGNDDANSLSSGSGNDILIGNGGNDNISAGSGNDTILAGTGDDYIDGGSGNDSYYYNYGDGMDTISDNGNFDVIVFNRGIDPEKLVYRNEGNDLRIMIDGSETQGVLIKNFFSSIDYKMAMI